MNDVGVGDAVVAWLGERVGVVGQLGRQPQVDDGPDPVVGQGGPPGLGQRPGCRSAPPRPSASPARPRSHTRPGRGRSRIPPTPAAGSTRVARSSRVPPVRARRGQPTGVPRRVDGRARSRPRLEGRDAEVREVEMAEHRTAAVMEALASVYDPCCQEKGLSVVDMGLVRQGRPRRRPGPGRAAADHRLVPVRGQPGRPDHRAGGRPARMAGSTVEVVWDEPGPPTGCPTRPAHPGALPAPPQGGRPMIGNDAIVFDGWPTSSTSRRTPWGRPGRCSSTTSTPSTTS